MKITIDKIKEFNPCQSGLDNLINYYPKFNYTMVEFLQLEHIPYDDKIWLVTKLVDVDVLKQWSVECAEKVMDNYNKVYPNDDRISNCIQVIKEYLAGNTGLEELNAARSAARSAAWSAARYAEAAARSARYAARSARSARSAWSAAWSAEAAAAAARSADSAAEAAARSARYAARSEEENLNLSILIALLENE